MTCMVIHWNLDISEILASTLDFRFSTFDILPDLFVKHGTLPTARHDPRSTTYDLPFPAPLRFCIRNQGSFSVAVRLKTSRDSEAWGSTQK